jgi:hypothetical protein
VAQALLALQHDACEAEYVSCFSPRQLEADMNKKIISIIAAGGLSLMASAAFAQSSAAQQQQPPPAASTSGMSGGMNNGMSSGMSGQSANTPPPFSTLDTRGNGYLTQQDASQNSWLGMHWSQCDADHDGKVTRTEYDACSQQQ